METEEEKREREREAQAHSEQLKAIPFKKPDKSKWPRNVRSIGWGETDHMGVDAEGRLYWDGELVKMERRIVLGTWELRWVAVAAVGALLSGITDLVDFGCDRPRFRQWAVCETASSPSPSAESRQAAPD